MGAPDAGSGARGGIAGMTRSLFLELRRARMCLPYVYRRKVVDAPSTAATTTSRWVGVATSNSWSGAGETEGREGESRSSTRWTREWQDSKRVNGLAERPCREKQANLLNDVVRELVLHHDL